MKLFLLIALLCAASFAATAQTNSDARPFDLRVKGVGYGSTYASVVKLLGKPKKSGTELVNASESCTGEAASYRKMIYEGLEIHLTGDGRGSGLKVYTIEITSTKWKTSGFTLGATEADVVAKIGKPRLRVSNDETADVTYEYEMVKGSGVTTLYFNKNKLIRIAMADAIC